MNNEQKELLDEVYENYCSIFTKKYNGENLKLNQYPLSEDVIHRLILSKEEFINKCKTNTEFSERWGLQIEERELSEEERWRIRFDYYPKDKQFPWDRMALPSHRFLDDFNIPTRAITITYNDKTIESYE